MPHICLGSPPPPLELNTDRCITVYCFCFLLSTYQWNKTSFISIFEWWPVNSPGSFVLKAFSIVTFLEIWAQKLFLMTALTLAHPFVKHVATQFISNVAYFGKSLSPPKPGKRISKEGGGGGGGLWRLTQIQIQIQICLFGVLYKYIDYFQISKNYK